ncbi:hypothetical protein Tco_0328533 [Tanacetum coccineum]
MYFLMEDLEEEPAPTGEHLLSCSKTAKQLAELKGIRKELGDLAIAIPDDPPSSFTMLRLLNHSGKQSNQGLEVGGDNGAQMVSGDMTGVIDFEIETSQLCFLMFKYLLSSSFSLLTYEYKNVPKTKSQIFFKNSLDKDIMIVKEEKNLAEAAWKFPGVPPANDRFSQADGYSCCSPPITRNLLKPRADISFTVYEDQLYRDKVIIKDGLRNAEDDVSEVQKQLVLLYFSMTNRVKEIQLKTMVNTAKVVFQQQQVLVYILLSKMRNRAVHKVSTRIGQLVTNLASFVLLGPVSTSYGLGNLRILVTRSMTVVDRCLLSHRLATKAYLSTMKITRMEALWLWKLIPKEVNVDVGIQDSYVAGSSGKDKGPTQEYILLPLQPHRTRIPVEDVAQLLMKKPSVISPKDNMIVQDLEDVAD